MRRAVLVALAAALAAAVAAGAGSAGFPGANGRIAYAGNGGAGFDVFTPRWHA